MMIFRANFYFSEIKTISGDKSGREIPDDNSENDRNGEVPIPEMPARQKIGGIWSYRDPGTEEVSAGSLSGLATKPWKFKVIKREDRTEQQIKRNEASPEAEDYLFPPNMHSH